MELDLDIKDLNKIVSALKGSNFDYSKWSDLGLKLGLIQRSLSTIKSDNSKDTEACLRETLVKWLNRVDNVDENGGTTWNTLVDALGKIDQKAVAESKQWICFVVTNIIFIIIIRIKRLNPIAYWKHHLVFYMLIIIMSSFILVTGIV